MTTAAEFDPGPAPSVKQVLIDIFPTNPVKAMVEGNMLQIIVFSILMGVAMTHSGEPGAQGAGRVPQLQRGDHDHGHLPDAHRALRGLLLLAKIFSELGLGAVLDLAKYFFTVVLVLLLHSLGVYSLLLKISELAGTADAVLDLLADCLNTWSGTRDAQTPGVGIPQGWKG